MCKIKTLAAAVMLASSGLSQAEFSVTQDYSFINVGLDDTLEVSRPTFITDTGTVFLKEFVGYSVEGKTNYVIDLPELRSLNESLDYLELYVATHQDALLTLPENTSPADARSLFENYPEPPTSETPLAIMTEIGIEDPQDPEQYLNYVTAVMHEALLVGFTPLGIVESEEMIGASETGYYFSSAQGGSEDADVYRCDRATYIPGVDVKNQLLSACSLLTSGITYSNVDTAMETANYSDLAAIKDDSLLEPTRVFQSGYQVAEITHDVDYSEAYSSGEPYGRDVRMIQSTGQKPLVAAVWGGIQDVTGIVPMQPMTNAEYVEFLSWITMFNDEIYYVHADGFAEQLSYTSGNSIVREFNDDYMVVQRLTLGDFGILQVNSEICTYSVTLNYGATGSDVIGDQGNLGGEVACTEVVESLPGYHEIILGYDTEVYAAAIATSGEGIAVDNMWGIPVYMKNMRTGERLELADAYRELRLEQGLGDMYAEDRMTNILNLVMEENGLPEDSADDDGVIEPALYMGLMDNYPMPPENPEYYGLWDDMSSDDFVSMIKHLKNNLVFTHSVNQDSSLLGTLEFFPRSRLSFKFTSPDTLLSGQGRFTFVNVEPFSISGTVEKQYQPDVLDVTIRLQNDAGDSFIGEPNEGGTYQMSDLAAGTYTVTATKDYFVHECATVTLTEQQRAGVVDITLLAGDLDNDGRIGVKDYGMFRVRDRFPEVDFDLNNDGVVDAADQQIVRDNAGAVQCQL